MSKQLIEAISADLLAATQFYCSNDADKDDVFRLLEGLIENVDDIREELTEVLGGKEYERQF